MSKEMDQKFSEASREKTKRLSTGRKSSEASRQLPLEDKISAMPTPDPSVKSNIVPDAVAMPDHGDSFDQQLRALIQGMGTEIERVQAEQQAKIETLVSERGNMEFKSQAQPAQSQGKTRSAPQISAKSHQAGPAADAATARNIAMLERRINAKAAELGLAEKRIAMLEERERQALEQGEQLKASLGVAQSDVRMLFDRMGQRLSDFSRNANMREAAVRDELAAERLQDRQDKVVAALRAEQAIVRQHLCAEAVRLAASRPAEAAATLALVQFDDEAVADAPLFRADDPVDFLATRGPGAMTLAIDASFEIDSAMRWTDAEFVAAAYRWLLDLDADHDIAASHINLLRRGQLRQDVLVDIAQSAEALARLEGGSLVQIKDDREFVQEAYRQLLGRAADAEGLNHYAGRLAGGAARRTIMMDMSASQEARRMSRPLSAALRGIGMVNDKIYRLRLGFRRWMPWSAHAKRYTSYAARIAGVECLSARRNQDAIAQLDEIRAMVGDRVDAAYRLGSKRALASISLLGTTGSAIAISSASIGQDAAEASNAIFSRLPRRGASRTPAQIIQAIRSEIKELELN